MATDGEAGRRAHRKGEIAKALVAQADKWLSEPPRIDTLEILAAKQRA